MAAIDAADAHRLAARAAGALLLATARYWPATASCVHEQLRHWELRAQAIPDPAERRLALEKLQGEGFNAQAAAMLATLAPRADRRHAAQAIVALELLFDYLDGLTEHPLDDPLREGERLFAPFIDAVDTSAAGCANDHDPGAGAARPDRHPSARAGSYLDELSSAVQTALAQLPAGSAIAEVARSSAARAAQAQIRMHAAASVGTAQLEAWAKEEAQRWSTSGTLAWRERLAGSASSVLALHALIAAAADPRTTPTEAEQIDEAYLSVCTVVTLLDGLVDHDADANGAPSYIGLYDNDEQLARALRSAARGALRQTQALRDGDHHAMTFAAAVAYYATAPGASSARARAVLAPLRRELGPLLHPPLLLMRTWRAAKAARGGRRNIEAHNGVESNMVSSC